MRRLWKRSLLVTALAATALLGAAVVFGPSSAPPAAPAAVPQPVNALDAYVSKTNAHLAHVPRDWQSWAQLGMAQIQLARITYDPAHYPVAETALRRSLAIRPKGNAAALTGMGALAAARHEFRGALKYARLAVAADPYSSDAYGVLTDANVELGQYPAATAAVQHMLDVRPDTGSFARASYLYELRGDIPRATELMERARAVSSEPSDITFTLQHLGELAFGTGDLAKAAGYYREGLQRQPGQPALLADRARVEAAGGDLRTAIADLRAATATLPTIDHLVALSDTLTAAGDTAGAAKTDDLVRVSTLLPGATTDIDLTVFYADRGDPVSAVRKGKKLLAGRPSVPVEAAYAWALHSAGRDREALVHADRSLRLGTRDAKSYFYRGMIRLALHDRLGARADLLFALTINPDFSLRYAPAARTALSHLGGVA